MSALDALLLAAAARGEVLHYAPPHVRRERGPHVTLVAMPRGAK